MNIKSVMKMSICLCLLNDLILSVFPSYQIHKHVITAGISSRGTATSTTPREETGTRLRESVAYMVLIWPASRPTKNNSLSTVSKTPVAF